MATDRVAVNRPIKSGQPNPVENPSHDTLIDALSDCDAPQLGFDQITGNQHVRGLVEPLDQGIALGLFDQQDTEGRRVDVHDRARGHRLSSRSSSRISERLLASVLGAIPNSAHPPRRRAGRTIRNVGSGSPSGTIFPTGTPLLVRTKDWPSPTARRTRPDSLRNSRWDRLLIRGSVSLMTHKRSARATRCCGESWFAPSVNRRRLCQGASAQGLACRPSAMSRTGLLTHLTLVFTGRSWNRVVLLSYFPTSAVKRRLVPTGTLSGDLSAGKWKS